MARTKRSRPSRSKTATQLQPLGDEQSAIVAVSSESESEHVPRARRSLVTPRGSETVLRDVAEKNCCDGTDDEERGCSLKCSCSVVLDPVSAMLCDECEVCLCPDCSCSKCLSHRTFKVSSICSTIQQLCAAKLDAIDTTYDAFIKEIGATSTTRAVHSKSKSKASARTPNLLAQANIIRREERVKVAQCTRDALNLVLMTFEIAADGDDGISDGFAPALLQAVRSVQAAHARQFRLELTKLSHEDAGSEGKEWTVQVANED